jgi:hypothetical protein
MAGENNSGKSGGGTDVVAAPTDRVGAFSGPRRGCSGVAAMLDFGKVSRDNLNCSRHITCGWEGD